MNSHDPGENQIDETDLGQASPAEADAEVTDPDGREPQDEEPVVGPVGLGVIVGKGGQLDGR